MVVEESEDPDNVVSINIQTQTVYRRKRLASNFNFNPILHTVRDRKSIPTIHSTNEPSTKWRPITVSLHK